MRQVQQMQQVDVIQQCLVRLRRLRMTSGMAFRQWPTAEALVAASKGANDGVQPLGCIRLKARVDLGDQTATILYL